MTHTTHHALTHTLVRPTHDRSPDSTCRRRLRSVTDTGGAERGTWATRRGLGGYDCTFSQRLAYAPRRHASARRTHTTHIVKLSGIGTAHDATCSRRVRMDALVIMHGHRWNGPGATHEERSAEGRGRNTLRPVPRRLRCVMSGSLSRPVPQSAARCLCLRRQLTGWPACRWSGTGW